MQANLRVLPVDWMKLWMNGRILIWQGTNMARHSHADGKPISHDLVQTWRKFTMDSGLCGNGGGVCVYKHLKPLSFPSKQGMIFRFPLPTLVLTPGWAIFQSVQKEFLCVTMK